ncbi:MAG: DUF2764 family protein [Candidatus Marinimicrobia bacterium]|nr:DUF2764 family protein [Candidatus Neomarinimicrobiota bacterium]
MDKYIYFATQLPLLVFDKEPALGIDVFLTEGRKWLSDSDYGMLIAVSINDTGPANNDPAALREFKTYENKLRNELVLYRKSQKARQEYKPRLFAAAVLKEGNPLDVEKKLLLLRWNILSELEFGHYSDMQFFILYYLKLQILQRLQQFDKDKGKEKFLTYTELAYEQD